MSKNNKQFNRQDDRSKVKLYKTHHGWMSSLTHFFKIFSFGNSAKRDSGQLINKDEFNSDELGNTASKYGKGAATIAATLGFTAGGAALGNEAHAATTAAADEGSQVVGSTSTSTASNSSSEKGSQSNADSQSTSSSSTKESQSGSKSVSSTSNTTSQSNSKSATRVRLASQLPNQLLQRVRMALLVRNQPALLPQRLTNQKLRVLLPLSLQP